MNLPRKWLFRRPGFYIPVFFLSLCQAWAREFPAEATVLALGGTYLARSFPHCAGYNQAALAWLDERTISLHQAQPFLMPEAGISSLTFSAPLANGGFGTSLGTYGIEGFRHMSLWLSYGIPLRAGVAAGIGLYFRDRVIREYGHHLGMSCALGLQARLNESLTVGLHVMHPVTWPERGNLQTGMPITMGIGLAYSFFQTASCYCDFRFSGVQGPVWSGGLEIPINKWLTMMAGFHTRAWTFTGGLFLNKSRWILAFAYTFCYEIGSTPSCSLSWQW